MILRGRCGSGRSTVGLLAVGLGVLLLSRSASGADEAIGYKGLSYANGSSDPTGSKPQSKLWWNDGFWWGSLFHSASETFRIYKLDAASQAWIDTGVELDERDTSRSDTLWDGTHLYIASHAYSSTPSSGYPSRLYRLSYDAGLDRYTLDPGFPAQINNYRTETLVIDKDTTGTLWATWVQGNQVHVSHTLGDDSTWVTPYPLPVSDASVSADDISSLIAFGPGKIGVLWSNQNDDKFYFAVHVDGQADTVWQSSPAIQGTNSADDHISLKTSSTDGRVFAAVKTSLSSSSQPLIQLLVRDPASGSWTAHTCGTVADNHTRPIVLLDEEQRTIHVFATGPYGGSDTGAIYEKTSSMDAISFPAGAGTPVMRDVATVDMNNVSSTKQNLSSNTGLVAIATNNLTFHYWHHHDPLGGGQPPQPPVASFIGAPTAGTAPLVVAFTDTSTGSPTAWSWDFGDGSPPSTAENPTHTYAAAGTYTVSLTAANAAGSDSVVRPGYITVGPPASTLTFRPIDDAQVRSSAPNKNYGQGTVLRLRQGTASSPTTYMSYLKFSVAGVSGAVGSVRLRLYVSDASDDGGSAYAVGSGWTESTITWNSAPPITGAPLAGAGAISSGTWIELNLGPGAVPADGVYSFALKNTSTNNAAYHSSEGANPPQLILTQEN